MSNYTLTVACNNGHARRNVGRFVRNTHGQIFASENVFTWTDDEVNFPGAETVPPGAVWSATARARYRLECPKCGRVRVLRQDTATQLVHDKHVAGVPRVTLAELP